ncbi:MAG: hypothetical protein ABJA78_10400 [Ferruginibacter sp.]
MNTLSGFPYCEIQFTKDATVFDPTAIDQLNDMLKNENVTDLLVVSHGWNNDMNDARLLYKNLIAQIAGQAGASTRKFGVLGVLWPSKKFAEKDLIAGGAASFENNDESAALQAQLKSLHGFFDDDNAATEILKKASVAAQSLEKGNTEQAQRDFVKQLALLFDNAVKKQSAANEKDINLSFTKEDPKVLLERLSYDFDEEKKATGTGGATAFEAGGQAAGLGDLFGNLISGAKNLLNYVTFYQMKERAGKVGANGLNAVLKNIRKQFPAVKLHLAGHSFGGRVVTAAAAGADEKDDLIVDTLTLLQAAFSHYGFAVNYDQHNSNGFFRRVIANKKVTGPVLITHTHNDTAVGIAYAIASRIAKQVAEGLGDANDKYGGMGGNGAQLTPETNNDFNLKVNDYHFNKGVIYNLNGDSCISNHSDICKTEVGKAILASIETT